MATRKKATAVAAKENQLPAEMMEELEGDAGLGQEGIGREDTIVPRIQILQSNSPAATKADPAAYIDGAEAGMILNTVTKALMDGTDGIRIVPITYRRAHIEWGLRENGGGFVADHGADPKVLEKCTTDDKNRQINPEGNHIVVTAEFFVFILDEKTGLYSPAVLSMSGTQLKKARDINARIQNNVMQGKKGAFTPPMFYNTFRLSIVPEKNDKGNWFGWKVSEQKPVLEFPDGADTYKSAKAFLDMVTQGDVKASEQASETAAAEDDDDPM